MNSIPATFLSYAADILGDTNKGLPGGAISKSFTAYAVDFDTDIPYGISVSGAPNKRTALFDNLMQFSSEQQYKIIRELCEHPNLKLPIADEINNLKIQLIARYGGYFGAASSETVNLSLIEDTKHWLDEYPASYKLYDSALTKFNNKIFERNLLDDLRLSLELLIKELFQNGKSLENQIPEIGTFISQNGGSKEFSNMFRVLVDYFSKYQNTFVKHNDCVIEEEVEFIFEMTSSFMKHFVKLKIRS